MLYQPQIECSEEELRALAGRGIRAHEERTALLVTALRNGRVGGRVAVHVGGRWQKMLRVYYAGRLAALCVDLEHARATLIDLERASREADDMARAYGGGVVRAQTLGDLRAGLCVHARPHDPACADSAPLWEAVGLPDDTPVSVLRDRWGPLAACLLAAADGRGPRVSAVAWVERALGTAVLRDADLRGAVLRCAVLRAADLRAADLRAADLEGAVLRGAVLQRAYLQRAYLQRADLRGAVLRCADLRAADLRYADLRGAVLEGAVLRGADLQRADLRGADLDGAWADVAPDGWVLRDGRLRRAS